MRAGNVIEPLEKLFTLIQPTEAILSLIQSYEREEQLELFQVFREIVLDELVFASAIMEKRKLSLSPEEKLEKKNKNGLRLVN